MKQRKTSISILLGLTVVATAWQLGCSNHPSERLSQYGAVEKPTERIQLSGSSTIGPLAGEIGKRYEKINPHVRVEVQTGGSSRGITDVKSGMVDIGMSSRDLKKSEKQGRMSWPIAMDGVCFIVHADNPVKELTKSQLASVFRGEVASWQELGGRDETVVVINRAAGRSELEMIAKFFDIQLDQIDADLIAGENQQGIKMVANTRNSICYMSVGYSEDAINRGSPIKMLPLNGVAATVANVEANEFPLSRPLIFVTTAEPSETVREFIHYAQSDSVQDLVRELSYVPITN